jgi:hypothetical protein
MIYKMICRALHVASDGTIPNAKNQHHEMLVLKNINMKYLLSLVDDQPFSHHLSILKLNLYKI